MNKSKISLQDHGQHNFRISLRRYFPIKIQKLRKLVNKYTDIASFTNIKQKYNFLNISEFFPTYFLKKKYSLQIFKGFWV